jgi:hypothetical protein
MKVIKQQTIQVMLKEDEREILYKGSSEYHITDEFISQLQSKGVLPKHLAMRKIAYHIREWRDELIVHLFWNINTLIKHQ